MIVLAANKRKISHEHVRFLGNQIPIFTLYVNIQNRFLLLSNFSTRHAYPHADGIGGNVK